MTKKLSRKKFSFFSFVTVSFSGVHNCDIMHYFCYIILLSTLNEVLILLSFFLSTIPQRQVEKKLSSPLPPTFVKLTYKQTKKNPHKVIMRSGYPLREGFDRRNKDQVRLRLRLSLLLLTTLTLSRSNNNRKKIVAAKNLRKDTYMFSCLS